MAAIAGDVARREVSGGISTTKDVVPSNTWSSESASWRSPSRRRTGPAPPRAASACHDLDRAGQDTVAIAFMAASADAVPAQWRRFAPWPNPARSSAFATRGVATGRATWTSTTGAKQPRLDDVAASPELSGSSSATAPARVLRFCLPASAIWLASIRADLGQHRIARDVRACRALQDASDCSATCSSARKSGSGATRAKIRRPPGASLAGGSLAGGTLPPHAQSQSVH
jgi:hypothetical protein